MTPYLDLARFKRSTRKGTAPEPLPTDYLLRKGATLVIEPAGERRKLFTISTETIDRDNDKVSLSGWDLTAYRKNPVVLWQHRSSMPPIGKTVEIGIVGDALKAVVEFVPADVPLIGEEAEMAWRLCDGGFVSAASVGFRPLEYTTAKDRMGDDDWWPPIDFTRQELMEWSICTIPANPEAVIEPGAALVGNPALAALPASRKAGAAAATRRRAERIAAYG
jgi:hypothetical protein